MIIRCLEVDHLKFLSSVEYLRWHPSFLECRWVSPGGCQRPPGPPGHVLLRWLGMWLVWGFLPRGAGTGWEQGQMQGLLETFFALNFNSGAGGLGVTGWFSAEGGLRSQVSFLVKRLCIWTPQSLRPSLKEYSAILKKLVPSFYVLLLWFLGAECHEITVRDPAWLDRFITPLPPCFFPKK